MRPLVVCALMLLCCALFTTGCARFRFWRKADSAPMLTHGPQVGTPAPELGEIDFDGAPVNLGDYRGKVVVVAFWGSNCPPCMRMIPHEQMLVDRYRDKPFAMIGVSTDTEPERALRVIRAKGMSWRNCQAGRDCSLNQRWGVTLLPSIFVIDAEGVVRGAHVTGDRLDQLVATLVADAERKR